MSEAAGSMRRWRSGLCALAAIVTGLALRGGAESAPAPAPTDRPAPVTSTSPDHPLPPTGTLELERADFPADRPVRVSLGLPVPSTDAQPRPVSMFSLTDQHGIRLQGHLDRTRTAVTIEVDPAFFRPGTYFVEVTTTERSPFPSRRYKIVVR